MPEPADPTERVGATTCWWHPERQTGLRCTRCERYACPSCLRDAAVGYQCVDCVQAGRREERALRAVHKRSGLGYRTVAGARASGNVIVTPVLILVNVLVFALTALESRSLTNNHISDVFQAGSIISPLVAGGEWWRLITSGFLHFGFLHLAMNMLALWVLGRDLERLLGAGRYLTLYGLSVLGGGAAVFAWSSPDVQTAGASGAVYGLLGAIVVAALRLKLHLGSIALIIGLNFFLTIQFGFSLMGHLGGIVVGLLVAVIMLYAPEKARMPVQIGGSVAVGVALLALVVVRDAQFGEVFCDAMQCSWTGTAR